MLKAIAKLLFFYYRLLVSDKGKLKEKTLSPVDFERFVEHFYNGIRVDKEEMATQALSIMEDRPHQINVLPVFDNNNFVGVIRIHDLLKVR